MTLLWPFRSLVSIALNHEGWENEGFGRKNDKPKMGELDRIRIYHHVYGKSHGRRSRVGWQSMGLRSQTRLSKFTFTFHFHALKKEMATHYSVLAWSIPGTGEPGGLPSMGSHRVGPDWSDLAVAAAAAYVNYCSAQKRWLLMSDSHVTCLWAGGLGERNRSQSFCLILPSLLSCLPPSLLLSWEKRGEEEGLSEDK